MSGIATTAKNLFGMGRDMKKVRRKRPIHGLNQAEIDAVNANMGTQADPKKRKRKSSIVGDLMGGREESL